MDVGFLLLQQQKNHNDHEVRRAQDPLMVRIGRAVPPTMAWLSG